MRRNKSFGRPITTSKTLGEKQLPSKDKVRNPVSGMNPKQVELAFIKHMKTLGISDEKLVKSIIAQVKPNPPE